MPRASWAGEGAAAAEVDAVPQASSLQVLTRAPQTQWEPSGKVPKDGRSPKHPGRQLAGRGCDAVVAAAPQAAGLRRGGGHTSPWLRVSGTGCSPTPAPRSSPKRPDGSLSTGPGAEARRPAPQRAPWRLAQCCQRRLRCTPRTADDASSMPPLRRCPAAALRGRPNGSPDAPSHDGRPMMRQTVACCRALRKAARRMRLMCL